MNTSDNSPALFTIYASSETIPQRCVDIRIVLELAEEGRWIIAEENISACFESYIVCGLEINARPEITILI